MCVCVCGGCVVVCVCVCVLCVSQSFDSRPSVVESNFAGESES